MNETLTTTIESGWGRQLLATSRRVTQWTFAALRLVLLLASLALITWVVNYNPVSWDLTETKFFSLSEQSRTVLETLNGPVTLTAFVRGAEDPAVERALRAYADVSRHVAFRLVDPDAEPALAADYQVRDYNTVIVEGFDRTRKVEEVAEPAITNAILAVARGEAVPVCFLSGHGERILQDKERAGLSAATRALTQTNYEPRLLNLGAAGAVPEDCRVVVIAGPQGDVLPAEREALEAFAADGGRLLLLLESRTSVPELATLVRGYGVQINDDFVIDTARNGQSVGLGVQVPMIDEYVLHPITEDFRLMTLFNMPRSVTPTSTIPEGLDVRPLAATTRSSWGETNFTPGAPVAWDEGEDLAGPLPLVIAVGEAIEETPRAYRDRMREGLPAPVGDPVLVVAGDVDFATNAYFAWQGNGDLFVNSINWLAGQQELISIGAKLVANKRVLLTDAQKALTFTFLVVLLPLFPAVAGVVTMIKKVK